MSKSLSSNSNTISIGSNLININLDWVNYRKYIDGTIKKSLSQYIESEDRYQLFSLDGNVVYTCMLVKNPAEYDETFTTPESITEYLSYISDFENNFKSVGNKSIVKRDSGNRPITVTETPKGQEYMDITHNFCDPCSWYQGSVQVEDEVLTSSNGTKWESVNTYWIDMYTGRMFSDDKVNSATNHKHKVIVKVDGVEKTVREAFETTGGDYQIYYEDGYIISFADWTGKTVECSYYYADDSTYTIKPDDGFMLNIESADVQFSLDCVMNDAIMFEVWVYNPADLPNKIMYDYTSYKNVKEVIEEGRVSESGLVPQMSGSSPRGMRSDVLEISMPYTRIREIHSAYGTELRVRLKNNRKYDGYLCSLSVYGNKEAE